MIPVILTRVKTRDGISLDGIYVKPKRKGDTALIWIHGYTSRFYSSQILIKELSARLSRQGIAYFKFNTRGHDIINRDGRGKNYLQGGAFEQFEDCLKDIQAMISFARKLGYKKIILAGHSTGANKIAYYWHKTKERAVKALLLLGPLSDIAGEAKRIGKKNLAKRLTIAEKLNKKNPKSLIPQNFEICGAGRYISLFRPGTNEDTFPYYDPKARWKAVGNIKVPILTVIGSRDEYLDRSAKTFVDAFHKNAAKTKKFTGVIIKNSGHNFTKKEKELAKVIVSWIGKI